MINRTELLLFDISKTGETGVEGASKVPTRSFEMTVGLTEESKLSGPTLVILI